MEQNYRTEPQFGRDDPFARQEVIPYPRGKKAKKEKSTLRSYVETIVLALLIALFLRLFVVSAYHVSSGSMSDTLLAGDYIFVSKLAYRYSPPKIGDIIVFENPYDASKDYIKRIVAAEGQTVEIMDKTLVIDGQIAAIPSLSKHIDRQVLPAELSTRDNFGPITVPAGQYFVMGDNRDDSFDSRSWGCLDKKYIKGKAAFVYLSYEPDPKAPKWESPYFTKIFQIPFYYLTSFWGQLRLGRIGTSF